MLIFIIFDNPTASQGLLRKHIFGKDSVKNSSRIFYIKAVRHLQNNTVVANFEENRLRIFFTNPIIASKSREAVAGGFSQTPYLQILIR